MRREGELGGLIVGAVVVAVCASLFLVDFEQLASRGNDTLKKNISLIIKPTLARCTSEVGKAQKEGRVPYSLNNFEWAPVDSNYISGTCKNFSNHTECVIDRINWFSSSFINLQEKTKFSELGDWCYKYKRTF